MNSPVERRGPQLSVDQLKAAAAEMRAINLTSIYAAGSGHPGGTLSVMDIAAALYLQVLNHDPLNPAWPERDRVFWSAGHKAPASPTSAESMSFGRRRRALLGLCE